MILPVAKPWGGGPFAKRMVEGRSKAPPSALRAATSPSLRDREDRCYKKTLSYKIRLD